MNPLAWLLEPNTPHLAVALLFFVAAAMVVPQQIANRRKPRIPRRGNDFSRNHERLDMEARLRSMPVSSNRKAARR